MNSNWQTFNQNYLFLENLSISLDSSRIVSGPDASPDLEVKLKAALSEMEKLEQGAIANQDEGRMVGHYWLRDTALSPDKTIANQISSSVEALKNFANSVLEGKITGQNNRTFCHVLVVGIGGSALGPQFINDCFWDYSSKGLQFHFCDNTDPDGIARTLAAIGANLDRTLTIVISKSGGTAETRNAALEVETCYSGASLDFAKHAVAITLANSKLDQKASAEKWLNSFYIWDWIGGRTSITSAVGLLPLLLLGMDADSFLEGAKQMDQAGRISNLAQNPAARLALSWFIVGEGAGNRAMVVLPYKDRLLLLGRYLQQLVMESLGKQFDRNGKEVHQGLVVYGNKGSSDQHAYIQQLREGRNDFFVTFIEVLKDSLLPKTKALEIEAGVCSGDFLNGFLHGTRAALQENNRPSILLTMDQINEKNLGALIALFERAVGLYASMININAYNQPGVEAGKKAAGKIIEIQKLVLKHLENKPKQEFTAENIAKSLSIEEEIETVYRVLEHLSANGRAGLHRGKRAEPSKTYYKVQH